MTIIIIKTVLALVTSFLLAHYLVPVFEKLALRLNFVDAPDGNLKNHKKPIPYLGGLAIYLSFLGTLALLFPFDAQVFPFFIGSTILLFIGLVDDLIVINQRQKFFGQIIAAICFMRAGLYLKEPFLFSNYWSIPLSFFWILSMINAFNLVDVMDGLATLLAITATASFLCMALYLNLTSVVILLAAFLGVLLGFFIYNKPPARIYLGDAGSLFVGGFMATVPFLFPWGLHNAHGFLVPIIILAIPALEIISLILIRWRKNIPFYIGSPDHFAIYLRKKGWSKKGVLVYIFFLACILFITGFAFLINKITLAVVAVLGGAFLLFWIGILVF